MNKYNKYIQEFHESNPIELEFIEKQLKDYLKDNQEDQTEIEKILDYLYSVKPNISKIGYKTILEKTEKWHKKLQSVKIKDNEIEWTDYEVILDYKDWFKIVQLKSKECYEREGKLMSHCVASYYGRNSKIYSLRDKDNKPHCTIEENQQIKGKWNWKIDPKYIDYIVKFLEKIWMTVWENEMKNLGYFKLDTIDKDLTCDELYNGYVYENKLDSVKDKDWDIYMWFWLLKLKKLVEVKLDFSLNWNFDISSMVGFIFKKTEKIIKEANNHSSTAVANESYSTAVARWSSSTAVANESSSTAVANNHSSTAVANESSSTAVARWSYSTAVARWSSSTAVANNHSSTAVANGKNSIALISSYKSKAKGTNWAWIILTEWDKEEINIINIQAKQVWTDWIKEDIFYKLEWWKFIEIKD